MPHAPRVCARCMCVRAHPQEVIEAEHKKLQEALAQIKSQVT
jgi:hypothetical protein